MKSLKVSNWTKKVLAGMLPVAFLFVTMFSGNVSYAAAPTTLRSLGQTMTNGKTIDCSSGNYADSNGTTGAGKGTISYSTYSGKSVITLDSLDIGIQGSSLIQAYGGNGELEIVLKGTNTINTRSASTISFSNNNIKFSGDGTLTINQISLEGTGGGGNVAIYGDVNSNVEFAGDAVITINASANNDGINVQNNVEIKGGTLNIVQNAVKASNNNPARAIEAHGDIIITGGNVNAILTNPDAEGSPIYSEGNITISNANVKAIGEASKKSPYGIETKGGGVTTINKGSTVEMFGKEAANFEQVAIDDTVTWEVTAGDTAETAVKLEETKAADILAKLKANKYSYVKINEPAPVAATEATDKLPKTGNTGAIMPYVLLLVAGVFTVIIANKKKAF